jgi:hypothetical protein
MAAKRKKKGLGRSCPRAYRWRETWDRREGSTGTGRPGQTSASAWQAASERGRRVASMLCAPEHRARARRLSGTESERMG